MRKKFLALVSLSLGTLFYFDFAQAGAKIPEGSGPPPKLPAVAPATTPSQKRKPSSVQISSPRGGSQDLSSPLGKRKSSSVQVTSPRGRDNQDLSSPRSPQAPHTPRTPRPGTPRAPRPQTPRPQPAANPVVRAPLCTLVLPNTFNVEGLLRVCQGDRVTVMEADNVPEGLVFARNGEQEGQILAQTLELNEHAANIYLEIADFLVAHPPLLRRLIQQLEKEREEQIALGEEGVDQIARLVDVFAARRLLPEALQTMFELEIGATRDVNVLFRDRTPAVMLATAVFNRPGSMQKFRKRILEEIIAALQQRETHGLSTLLEILEAYIEQLTTMPDAEIPGELGAILSAIRKAAQSANMSNDQVSALMGNMFCLRFLVPTLAQSNRYIEMDADLQIVVRTLSRMLQMISNQVDPDVEHAFFPVANQMRFLQIPLIGMHNRLAAVPGRNVLVMQAQIDNALDLYRRVLKLATEMGLNETDVLLLQELLGSPDAPCYEEIGRRRSVIRKLDPDLL